MKIKKCGRCKIIFASLICIFPFLWAIIITKRHKSDGKGKVNMNRRIRRNRKNSLRRERIIMITSSAFVLAALTMTGAYFNNQNAESKDDGYTIDFAALEDTAEDKSNELAQNMAEEEADASLQMAQVDTQKQIAQSDVQLQMAQTDVQLQLEEANTTRELLNEIASDIEVENDMLQASAAEGSLEESEMNDEGNGEVVSQEVEVSSGQVEVARTLHFSEETGLVRPISGDILMHYSMEGSIYFATLDQYKYNPATIFAAEEGTMVSACAEAKVQDIYANEELGNIVVLELGDGYLATYGQLKNLEVEEGDFVKAGDVIGSVAAPTKYYSVEGTNLYFQIAKDGVPVNSEGLFQ